MGNDPVGNRARDTHIQCVSHIPGRESAGFMFGLLARDANLESIPSERFAKASPWAIFGCVGGSYLAYPRREYPASGTVRSQCFLVIVEHLY